MQGTNSENGQTKGCQGYGHLVLVPIPDDANPGPLIDLALAMVCPDDGRVVALLLRMSEPEVDALKRHQIEPLIESYQDGGQPVELVVHSSSSVTRGILDAARELRADILVLDARMPAEGGARLGTIAENILPISPCPTVLFRPGATGTYGRLVVPILEGRTAKSASRLAVSLGRRLDAPVEALYLEIEAPERESTYWKDLETRNAALFDEHIHVKQTVVQVQEAIDGFLSNAQEDDLAVAGLTEQDEWEGWFRGDKPLDSLRDWPGGFLVSAFAEVVLPRPWWQKFRSWLKPSVTQFEADELKQDAAESAFTSLDYVTLIVIAAILASYGLVLNSNAVIIGAMLVAPLMTPLVAFATGMAVGNITTVRHATGTLLQGVLIALLIAFLLGVISPTSIVTSEMAGRGNVTFIDMGVALASGVIAAYAKGRKSISSAVAGVAIAAGLMPPLCTVGLALAFDDPELAQGALLLFTTNIISIILAAWVTLFWLGLRPGREDDPTARRRVTYLLALALVIVLAGLNIQRINAAPTGQVEGALMDAFRQAELVDFEIRQGDPLQVRATIRQPFSNLDDGSEIIAAQEALDKTLGRPVELSVIIQPVVDAAAAAAEAELDVMAEKILQDNLRSAELVGFEIIVGNPTVVFALISTDADPDSDPLASEIRSAEQALTQAGGVQVDVQILVTEATFGEEVEKTNAVLADTIEKGLRESLQPHELVSFDFSVGNPFIVTAVVVTDVDPTSEEFLALIEAAEDALSDALGLPVRLSVTTKSSGPGVDSPTETAVPTTVPTLEQTSEPTEAPAQPEASTPTEAPMATTAPAPTETVVPTTEVTPTEGGAP
jgi:uncharacterized hydrophobic protein (TIGR00271 family)